MKVAIALLCSIVLSATNAQSQRSASAQLMDRSSTISLPGASSWSFSISGLIQTGGDDWILWYESFGSGSNVLDNRSACNGVQGFSLGVDVASEYRITSRLALGVAVRYIPTKLHAEVHYPVTYKSILEVEKPDARISYIPVRLTAGYDLFRGERWSIHTGVQCGVGIFGTTDVRSNVGKSRRFYGDGSLVLGCQVGVTHALTKGLAATSFLQYQKTSFRVEELGTGDLKQTYDFRPLSLSLGLQYTLSD